MCAIVGMKTETDLRAVDAMLASVKHRGPDDHRTVQAGKWAIGHARLSILDPAHGKQPMIDKKTSAHIVHNGEIYNFRELRKEMGGRFKTDSDTEVILRLHQSGAEPEDWISRLDGMYAFAIIDEDGLLLARDPMGVKPLYMGVKGDQIMFGSEMKALQKIADRIMEFPPGHVYTSKGGGRPVAQGKPALKAGLDADLIAKELLGRITDAVHSRMISDVPLGVFLSGGLDSSMIAAIANQFAPGLKTFAVGMEGSADIEAARKVADAIGTDHHERIFTLEEAVRYLPTVIYHLESYDRSLVRSAIANYFLAELAAKHVKVALSGEGADELFAGYQYLKRLHGERLGQELDLITDELHATNLQRCDRMSMAHGLEVRVPLLDDPRVVEYAKVIPLQFKLEPRTLTEKWILRKAVEGLLPAETVWREKVKFAAGAGLGDQLAEWAESAISDDAFAAAKAKYERFDLRDKEEFAYFLIFRKRLSPEKIGPLLGRSRSL